MPKPNLRVDQLARAFFNNCAIAAGMNDAEAALECCRNAGEIEHAYALRLKTSEGASTKDERPSADDSARGSTFAGRRMQARFASRCAVCSLGISEGSEIIYNAEIRKAAHAGCAS